MLFCIFRKPNTRVSRGDKDKVKDSVKLEFMRIKQLYLSKQQFH